jgi:hypothetical protein
MLINIIFLVIAMVVFSLLLKAHNLIKNSSDEEIEYYKKWLNNRLKQ